MPPRLEPIFGGELRDTVMNDTSVTVIANPASAGGRTGKRLEQLRQLLRENLGDSITVTTTERRGDATRLAFQAAMEGCELLVSLGGDGTANEVANGMAPGGRALNPRSRLGIVRSGTGQGLARSLSLPPDPESQIRLIASGLTRTIDLGRVQWNAPEGPRSWMFLSECQIGIGAAVVREAERRGKRLGGLLCFGLTSLHQAWCCRTMPLELILDRTELIDGPALGISIGNGSSTGGGMRLTPDALLDDGFLDLLVLPAQNRFERFRSFPSIYSGAHLANPHFQHRRVRRIECSSPTRVPLAADGELLGDLPAVITICPAALRLCAVPTTKETSHEITPAHAAPVAV
jgi:diacylglycerol kinase (ATP)